jgi:division protein CdvB (Snf7/Vps24/ESCRT-III family)
MLLEQGPENCRTSQESTDQQGVLSTTEELKSTLTKRLHNACWKVNKAATDLYKVIARLRNLKS